VLALTRCERFRFSWRGCSRVNPSRQHINFRGRERRSVGRHFGHPTITAADGDHQKTFAILAWDDRHTAVSAEHKRVSSIETKAGLLRLFAMTAETFCRKDWPDVSFEVDARFRGPHDNCHRAQDQGNG
jgi:hypothetical protein